MYEYITGIFKGIKKDYVVVENNGIGYKIYSSGNSISNMPPVNEAVTLFLEQIVREDFIGLYGFLSKEEIDMFNRLRSVNGVGAKATLSMLSISNVNNLKYAIMQGDENTLIKAPGIGKKTAQRIILEMKDKISQTELLDGNNIELSLENIDIISDAKEALMSLGYLERDVEKILKKMPLNKEITLEIIIKQSLLELMK